MQTKGLYWISCVYRGETDKTENKLNCLKTFMKIEYCILGSINQEEEIRP